MADVHFVCTYSQPPIPLRKGESMLFEWDERKREANLAKHFIDFDDVRRVFDGPVFEKVYSRHGEDRTLAIGLMQGIEIVVVYVLRGERRRIISARRAHRNERQDYANHLKPAHEG
jgi:hypothetical protein